MASTKTDVIFQMNDEIIIFFCPACQDYHDIHIKGEIKWKWNGDKKKPTISPSLLVQGGSKALYCHSIIKDGKIYYYEDSKHSWAGRTLQMIRRKEWK